MAEAETVIPIKHLEDITECPICQEVYTDPRTLPCIHTYCFKCIATWVENKLPHHSGNCPICRKEFVIPDKGVGDLPKNIFIGKLLTVKEISSVNVKSKLCDSCESDTRIPNEAKTARVYCVECEEHLCENCKDRHANRKATRLHRLLVSGENLCQVSQCLPSKCEKHPDKNLDIYCFKCKEAMCLMCFVTQHNGHEANDLNEVVNEFKTKMTRSITQLNGGLSRLYDSLKRLECRRNELSSQAIAVEIEICERAEQLKAIIDRHRDELLSEVEEMKEAKARVIEKNVSEVEQNKAMIESLIKYSQELLKKGSNSDIVRESSSLSARTEEMAKMCEAEGSVDVSEELISFSSVEIICDDNNCIGNVRADIMTQLDGKWSLVEASNLAAYCDKVNYTEDYKVKLHRLADAIKSDPNVYIEEIHVNKDAKTLHRTVLINGEAKKDSGDFPIDVERDAHSADGRPAKIKVEFDAGKHQLIRHENGQGFTSVTTYELEGDKLVVTSTSGGVSSVMKFKHV